MELQGASAIVTGASRGIGPYIARALLSRGANVTLAARSADDLEHVERSLRSNGPVTSVEGDVTKAADRKRILRHAEEAHGPVDVLINNAGVEVIGRFVDLTAQEVSRIVRTNLESTIQLTLLAVPGMVERGKGHVVNISSLAGKAAVPYNTVYSSTKHALVGFSLGLWAELQEAGVGVSVICPGYVREAGMFSRQPHEQQPSGGTGTTPQEVAKAVVRAIEKEKPEIVVAGLLPRIADVSLAISPRMTVAMARRVGGYKPFQEAIAQAGKADSQETAKGTLLPRGKRLRG
jgi:short-subunit dehydrogenase